MAKIGQKHVFHQKVRFSWGAPILSIPRPIHRPGLGPGPSLGPSIRGDIAAVQKDSRADSVDLEILPHLSIDSGADLWTMD